MTSTHAIDLPENPTVLVAEDDEDLAETYDFWLRDEYDVRVATDGEEALETYGDEVDVVLLDRRMPVMAGDETLDRLKEKDPAVRVAMVTAVEPSVDIVEMRFDDYLVKPVGRDQIRDTVEELLVLASLDEEIRSYYSLQSTLVAAEESAAPTPSEAPEWLVELRHQVERERAALEASLEDVDGVDSGEFDELFECETRLS
ncbi:response regulator [Haloarchaeobius sp. DFWS5]|uniref:response regulator n=1 Tax=Haloarchaeobius sp. DFWS5 TaxID=3446114 RepID=UPI003EBB2650